MPYHGPLSHISRHSLGGDLVDLWRVVHFAVCNEQRPFVLDTLWSQSEVNLIMADLLGLRPES